MTRPDVRIFPDLDGLSRAAADIVLERSLHAISDRGRFTAALSGAFTPKKLYSLFAEPPWREKLPWPKMHLFWVDERCVPPDHPESNYLLAREAFLTRVPLPPENVHRMRGEDGADRAAESYEQELYTFFSGSLPRFDLILLGVGEDGHTASLFPETASLRERVHLVLPVHLEPPKLDRVTLTLPVLCNAEAVLFLVAGRNKASVVHEVVEDRNPRNYPSGMVRPAHGTLTWMLDRAAASLTGSAQAR